MHLYNEKREKNMNIKLFFITFLSVFMFNNFCYAASCEDTLLHQAIREGKKSVVQELLENNKYDIEVPGDLERTPLFLAVDSRDLEIIDLLLAKKADPRAYDQFDRSVFHEALFKIHNSGGREKSIAVLKRLLEHDPALASFEGKSIGTGRFFNIPLCFALFKGDLELFVLLLEHLKKHSFASIIPKEYSLVIIDHAGEFHSANFPQNIIPITIATVAILLEKMRKICETMNASDPSQAGLIEVMFHIFMTQIQEELTLRKTEVQKVT